MSFSSTCFNQSMRTIWIPSANECKSFSSMQTISSAGHSCFSDNCSKFPYFLVFSYILRFLSHSWVACSYFSLLYFLVQLPWPNPSHSIYLFIKSSISWTDLFTRVRKHPVCLNSSCELGHGIFSFICLFP